jgi:hypothetical protein
LCYALPRHPRLRSFLLALTMNAASYAVGYFFPWQ